MCSAFALFGRRSRRTLSITAAEHYANAALNWAETQTGKPYIYGGVGPYGYDCSGLIYAAFRHIGRPFPTWARSTFSMLAWAGLRRIPIAGAPRGALLFFGSGHVEFNTIWPNTSFGALQTGTLIGWHHYWWNSSWHPTAAYLVVGLPSGRCRWPVWSPLPMAGRRAPPP